MYLIFFFFFLKKIFFSYVEYWVFIDVYNDYLKKYFKNQYYKYKSLNIILYL